MESESLRSLTSSAAWVVQAGGSSFPDTNNLNPTRQIGGMPTLAQADIPAARLRVSDRYLVSARY